MPTYDYKCAECGNVFEKFHGMSEIPVVECPNCASKNTARQVSLGAGIVFKGSGFYVNDYKKGGESAAKSGAPAKTETPAAQKTETASAPSHACGPSCSHGS